MGQTKQLLPVEGRPMLQHAVDVAEASGVDEIIVVLGHDAERVATALRLPDRAYVVVNTDFPSGQASSLRAGLAATSPESDAAVILLGDEPGVTADAVRIVVDAYRRDRARIVRAVYEGQPGHPVLLSRHCWNDVAALDGDVGARQLVALHPDWTTDVETGKTAPPDVDTPEDYDRLLGGTSSGAEPGPGPGA
jgi:molybdenum cofactor cytidylyltransferase